MISKYSITLLILYLFLETIDSFYSINTRMLSKRSVKKNANIIASYSTKNDDSDITMDKNDDEDSNQEEFKGFGKKKLKTPPSEIQNYNNQVIQDPKVDKAIQASGRFTRMRENREKELDEKIAMLKEEDDLIATDPSVGAVPQIVADRMITRIATFFGVPVFGGLLLFGVSLYVSKTSDFVIPPNLLAYATQAPFVLGLIGITYGILSASWEPDNEGSMLGIEEFKTNYNRIQEGLQRTRDTAALREEIEEEKRKLGRK